MTNIGYQQWLKQNWPSIIGWEKNWENQQNIGCNEIYQRKKSSMRRRARQARAVPSTVFLGDFLRLSLCIQQPNLNFKKSNGLDFTRVFVKASNYQICDLIVKNQIWPDPTTRICFQRPYKDLIARCEPNFNLMTKINLQRLFDNPTTSLTKKKKSINTHTIHSISCIKFWHFFFYLHQIF